MSRQGPPVGLIIVVVAVTAAGLLLWMLVRSADDDGTSAGTPGAQPTSPGGPGERVAQGAQGAPAAPDSPGGARPYGAAPPREGPRLPPGAPGTVDTERPGAPKVTDSEAIRRGSSDRPPATETVVNGVRVRDHRRDRSKPITLPTTRPPPRDRRIAPELTGEITTRILPIVRDCATANLPPEVRGPKPRVEGQVVIAIKEQQARITHAVVELSDVTGATVDVARRCIEDKSVGVTLPAANEADLEDYPIRISYAIPSR